MPRPKQIIPIPSNTLDLVRDIAKNNPEHREFFLKLIGAEGAETQDASTELIEGFKDTDIKISINDARRLTEGLFSLLNEIVKNRQRQQGYRQKIKKEEKPVKKLQVDW